MLIARDLSYNNSDISCAILTLAAEVGKVLNGLRTSDLQHWRLTTGARLL